MQKSGAQENFSAYTDKFVNKFKQNVHCYYWKPQLKPRALLLLNHGYTEHGMLYEDLAKAMVQRGFFVFIHDQIGHGHSDGTRAYINDFQDLVDDTVLHIQKVRKEYPDLPLFVCGHSMGGAVTGHLALEKDLDIKGIVLIGPALSVNPETATPFKLFVGNFLKKWIPSCPMGVTDFSIVCRPKENVEKMNNDPLRYKGFWRARPLFSILSGAEELLSKAPEVKVPLLLLQGDDDKLCHISGAREFFKQSSSTDKSLQIYPGAYHSLLYEPEDVAKDAFEKIVKWLDERA